MELLKCDFLSPSDIWQTISQWNEYLVPYEERKKQVQKKYSDAINRMHFDDSKGEASRIIKAKTEDGKEVEVDLSKWDF